MKEGIRQSMAWLHTWSGLLVGWILFMVFAAGTASYFRDEITLWMKPELHGVAHAVVPQAVAVANAVETLQDKAPKSQRWFITLPTEREPGLRVSYNAKPPPGEGGGRQRNLKNLTLDPATGAELSAPRETRGGDFLYRLHFDLHYMSPLWGRWIVGFCAMFMLVAILSGIVTHKRIFKDFFTFRPKKGQRSWLDFHNVSAVLALPYHLMITYTGLLTLMFMYFPQGIQAVYQDKQETFFSELFGNPPSDAKAARVPAPLAPLAPMVEQATRTWNGAPVGRVTVAFPNDANATVSITQQTGHAISYDVPTIVFDGVTGRVASAAPEHSGAAKDTRGVMYGLHVARFGDPFTRWLFFTCGLAGCLMVATGLLLWAVKERPKHLKAHAGKVGFSLRLVDGLNIAAVAGLPLAMAVYFWANRLIETGIAQRPEAEIRWFFTAWGIAAIAALVKPGRPMWRIQLALGGLAFALLPLLNGVTGGAHLGTSIARGIWAVAGFDLVTLLLGAFLLYSSHYLGKARAPKAARAAPTPGSGTDAKPELAGSNA
ncbi:PepSY-associated TM helix domain-containing protein [Pseudoduganella albidiflava]|uniref:Membrane protein n=1 Tax=Pseudoduganella albidiflava TaxID=321983 RepID=A0A411X4B4_9BURK|nr:PepSY-associated TM helix domain-containing protein [Pseudoduganella albidiflava]QBI03857.1 PepSY domain-containing protein [Pseudoduganella albidiflava]GGY22818.1 membrane protein [Pseudoduganella albidiflava]